MTAARLLVVVAAVLVAVPAGAQDAHRDRCQPVSPTHEVLVTTATAGTIRGTLMCLGSAEVRLVRDGVDVRTPLDDVLQIRTKADPTWDGAVKGAAIPLILFTVLCGACDSEMVLRSTAAYALVGWTVDAIDSNSETIYRRGARAPAVAMRVGF